MSTPPNTPDPLSTIRERVVRLWRAYNDGWHFSDEPIGDIGEEMAALPADDLDALLSRLVRVEKALAECVDLAEEGWSYAGDYFREKWASDERIRQARTALGGGAANGKEG